MPNAGSRGARSTARAVLQAHVNRRVVMHVCLSADAQEWLHRFLDNERGNPRYTLGSAVPSRLRGPGLPETAVVHINTADCVGRTTCVPWYQARLDLPGRTVPVTVIPLVASAERKKADWTLIRKHPNILPILGHGRLTCGDNTRLGRTAVMVPHLSGTDLRTYLRKCPGANRRHLIEQVAEGLQFLHDQSVVYEELGPYSVIVNDFGDVVLDNSRLIAWMCKHVGRGPFRLTAVDAQQPPQYVAPEIVLDEAHQPPINRRPKTRQSDMYAFGMLVYEILSGRKPWADATLVDILRCIVTGQLLPRPEDGTINDSMWSLCIACWNQNPVCRPSIATVLAGLRSDTPPTCWRPNEVVGGDLAVERSLRLKRPSPGEDTRYTTATDVEVEINKSAVRIFLKKQDPMGGAFGTVMKGYGFMQDQIRPFAVKVCRGKNVMPREYEIWKSLSHINILPLLGMVDTNLPGSRERIFVSPYMDGGNLAKYLEAHPRRLRLRPMIDVATGLAYLHDIKTIVHGDIKPENVLITRCGMAMLADFGLSTYVTPRRQETALEIRQVYTLAYCAPEVLDDTAEDPGAPGVIRSKTRMSDMFAYGVLLYQTYAGGIGQSKRDRMKLMLDMYDGHFPPRLLVGSMASDPELCDDIWSICTRCWAKAPFQRPPIATVLAELNAS